MNEDESDPDYDIDSEEALSSNDTELLKQIRKTISNDKITKEKILQSNMPYSEKVRMIEYYDILENMEADNEEYLKLKYRLQEKLSETVSLSEAELQIYDEMVKSTAKTIPDKILRSDHTDDTKRILIKKYSMISTMDSASDEYTKTLNWINNVLDLPTNSKKSNFGANTMLDKLYHIQQTLDENIYGLNNVKQRVIEIMGNTILNTNLQKNINIPKIIVLVGPPGCGKTSFVKAIAESIDVPFQHIALGGIKDSSFLIGHSPTYIGSRPGIFVEILKRFKCTNGIVLLDEFDKVAKNAEGSEIYSTLLHILDPTQNNEFRDVYMPEIPIDLSNLFFIVAMNDETELETIIGLSDRLPIIYLNGYNFNDKVKIGLDYFVPKIVSALGMNSTDVIIKPDIMTYIIKTTDKPNDMGVRQLERNLYLLYERINLLKQTHNPNKNPLKKIRLSYAIQNFKIPLVLTTDHVDDLLK
jgi:ATP-dependent Lon protease